MKSPKSTKGLDWHVQGVGLLLKIDFLAFHTRNNGQS